MIVNKLQFIFLALIQQVPPPPNSTTKMGPTPPGDVIPLDSDIWVLLTIAVAIILYVALPKIKKAS